MHPFALHFSAISSPMSARLSAREHPQGHRELLPEVEVHDGQQLDLLVARAGLRHSSLNDCHLHARRQLVHQAHEDAKCGRVPLLESAWSTGSLSLRLPSL